MLRERIALQFVVIRAIVLSDSPCLGGGAPGLLPGVDRVQLEGFAFLKGATQPEVITGHLMLEECIASQSGVIRAIVSG